MIINVRVQAARFARLFVVALLTQAAALDGQHLTRSIAISAVVGAAETAWRQFKKPPDAYTARH